MTAASFTIFDAFTTHSFSYKAIGDHPINVAVIAPTDINAGKKPVVVRFHDGFMVDI